MKGIARFSLRRGVQALLGAALTLPLLCATLHALPFNDDLVNVQPRTGSLSRARPANTVPIGSLAYRAEGVAEVQSWQNPQPADEHSIDSGKRLFMANCSTCHGDIRKIPVAVGPSGSKLLKQPPDIGSADFRNRTDGGIYGTITFGLGLMPRLGWKLSPRERWDIVNFVRSVQSSR